MKNICVLLKNAAYVRTEKSFFETAIKDLNKKLTYYFMPFYVKFSLLQNLKQYKVIS